MPGKYFSKKHRIDGHVLDSQGEVKRYGELKMLEKAREITDLRVHPQYELNVNGEKVGLYTADFAYASKTGTPMIEDCKSAATMTEASSLRIRLFQAIYGARVTLVGKDVPQVRRFKRRAA